MSKSPRVFILSSSSESGVANRLSSLLGDKSGQKVEPFDLRTARKLPATESAWFVLLLSPELKRLAQELNWVMDHHPDRVLPVLVRKCAPGDVHRDLELLTAYDLTAQSEDAVKRLAREWRNGLTRAKPDNSVVMFLSMKGGVAKTTNLVAVAECLAERGNRVLVIDTDHQCGSSAVLLGEEKLDEMERKKSTLADLFWETLNNDFLPDRIAHFARPAKSVEGIGRSLSVVPGSLRLEDFWSHYRQTSGREAQTAAQAFTFLRNKRSPQVRAWLKANYDYVLVDCPPTISWQVRFFLLVADAYVVPAIPDRLSVRGARYLTRRIKNIGASIHPAGLLWSMYREQCSIHREYVERIRTGEERMDWEDESAPRLPPPFKERIPHGNDVIENSLDPDSQPRSFAAKYGTDFGKRYREVTRELLGRLRSAKPVTSPQPARATPAPPVKVPADVS